MNECMMEMHYIADKTIAVLKSCKTYDQILIGKRYARRAMKLLSGSAYIRVEEIYWKLPQDSVLNRRLINNN